MLFKLIRVNTTSKRRTLLVTNKTLPEIENLIPKVDLKRKTSYLAIEEQKSEYVSVGLLEKES